MNDMITAPADFLPDRIARPITDGHDSARSALFLGDGAMPLEVLVVRHAHPPNVADLRAAWAHRWDRRPAPVILVALQGDRAWLCVPMSDDKPEILRDMDHERAKRLCDAALDEPGPEEARRFLYAQVPALQAGTDGIRNEGLFANHALDRWPEQADDADRARRIAGQKDRRLLEGLGYDVAQADNLSLLLRQGERDEALAVLLRRDERPEAKTDRFNGLSPISYAITKGEARGLPWVVLLKGRELRLYPTANRGVSARGATETYLEINLATLPDDHVGRLWSLFSAEALAPGGTVERLLIESRDYAADLAVRLRERIYTETVPSLAAAIVAARGIQNPDRQELDRTYRMALLVLFRLLFIAYAEDGDLLPYRSNAAFQKRSLKSKAHDLLVAHREGVAPGGHDHHWREVQGLFEAIDHGNAEWGVPAYNGGLFSSDPDVSSEGAEIARLSLPDVAFAPALRSLLLAFEPDGSVVGPVDFRSLGVREFGTIYEGLLESELTVAQADLVSRNAVRARPRANPKPEDLILQPTEPGQTPEVRAGEVYLHNRSGARKASGSYYTKPFAVEHLLDRALEPAIDEHLVRVDKLEDAAAARALFDFRVADIAMGSGHFLIAAIDRIERRFARYLIERRDAGRPVNAVFNELNALRSAAERALGRGAAAVEIEDTQLLRRLIARRCIYGVDVNDMAVMLARLAVWVHSFVPGLPLAVLDHNLAVGNALVGMGSKEAIQARLDEARHDLFGQDVGQWMDRAMPALRRLQTVADATLADVEASREALAEAKRQLSDLRDLCDVLVAEPLAEGIYFDADHWSKPDDLERNAMVRAARDALDGLRPFHFPVEMPEVFLRARPGFDVMLGNPPWKEATVEALAFWARHFPGLRGLSSAEQKVRMDRLPVERPDLVPIYDAEVEVAARFRRTLTSGGFPGMGTGDPDVYKAFLWRFWSLTAQDSGRFGVVLPRSAWAAKGSTEFRQAVFGEARAVDLTMLQNKAGWAFDEVEHRYTIALTAVTRKAEGGGAAVALVGPFADAVAYEAGTAAEPHRFDGMDALGWNDTASLPLLPGPDSFAVFARMREAPRLDRNVPGEWRARPDTDLHATADRPLMDFSGEPPAGAWPVMKGESFNIWQPEGGALYAWAEPGPALERLQRKRRRPRIGSAHAEFPAAHLRDEATLAPHRPRIAFRDIARATDNRTMIAALVPPQQLVANQAPYLLWPRGDEADAAFLLGVICSIPLDWYARRYVETHANFFVVNPFPIPRPPRTDPLWRRTAALAGRLAAVDERYADWAAAVGVDHGPVPQDEKDDMIHELDALSAHLYRLDRGQLTHVFETFHEGWDHRPRLNAVLARYDAWTARGAQEAAQ